MEKYEIFTHTYPTCLHTQKFRATKEFMEAMNETTNNKKFGLCSNCYIRFCENNNITPWFKEKS